MCDRINDRIQVFRRDSTFVQEWSYETATLGNSSVWDLVIWPDAQQTFLFNVNGENNEARILQREDGTVIGAFGRSRRQAGQFH